MSHCLLCFLQIQKFERAAGLRGILLGTGDRLIAEASPTDRIWGIGKCSCSILCVSFPSEASKKLLLSGMRESDPATARPADWRGSNILGWALMEARVVLLRERAV